MSLPLPTELQCLAQRMRVTAQELRQAAAQLPDVFAAATGWQPGLAEHPGLNGVAKDMVAQARALEFDAQRMQGLAAEQADCDRALFAHTTYLVDTCRINRAAMGAGVSVALPDVAEESLGQMQELLAPRFPGEPIPGG